MGSTPNRLPLDKQWPEMSMIDEWLIQFWGADG